MKNNRREFLKLAGMTGPYKRSMSPILLKSWVKLQSRWGLMVAVNF